MRTKSVSNETHTTKLDQSNTKTSLEEDLKWVEENVPATLTEG